MIRRKRTFFRSNDFLKFSHCLIFFFYLFFCRAEIKTQHQGVSPKKEKLTEWLSSSIAELRSEISELQASASNLTKSCHQRNLFAEDIRSVRDEMNTFRLEISAIKTRQDKSDIMLRELREEIIQNSEETSRSLPKHKTVRIINKLSNRFTCRACIYTEIFPSQTFETNEDREPCLLPGESSFL